MTARAPSGITALIVVTMRWTIRTSQSRMPLTMAAVGGVRKSMTQPSTAADLQFARDTLLQLPFDNLGREAQWRELMRIGEIR